MCATTTTRYAKTTKCLYNILLTIANKLKCFETNNNWNCVKNNTETEKLSIKKQKAATKQNKLHPARPRYYNLDYAFNY